MVELLVSQGADVTMANREGQTAVQLASTTVIRQLLLAAVDKGGPHHNLCQAAWQGNTALLHRILVCVAIIIAYNYNNRNNSKTMFMVLSSYHCESSPGSFD